MMRSLKIACRDGYEALMTEATGDESNEEA
jgi:hypothetical protein